MIPLAHLDPISGSAPAGISIVQGDLTSLLATSPVDALLVSAFLDDYLPTPNSLIGALSRAGVDVAALARNKADDLRDVGRCWVSEALPEAQARALGFRYLICFEMDRSRKESLEESIASIGHALAAAMHGRGITSIAMPIIATGEQQYPVATVAPPLLRMLAHQMRFGSPLERAILAIYRPADAQAVMEALADVRHEIQQRPQAPSLTRPRHDVFISYQHADSTSVDIFQAALKAHAGNCSVWRDTTRLAQGASWNLEIATAIDSTRQFVPFYSRQYFNSLICKEELAAAHIRRRVVRIAFIQPVLLDDVPLSSYLQTTQYRDSRTNRDDALKAAARHVASLLSRPPAPYEPPL